MILVSYDIKDDKLRTKFAKFLSKFGHRIQYSVFEIHNGPSVLSNIEFEIKNRFEKRFCQDDSVIIFRLSPSCKKTCYGSAKNEDVELFVVV